MTVIEVDKVSKCYALHQQRDLLARRVLRNTSPVRGEYWALRDVSIRVERGERLAIIGSNGAGKSTLLRLIAGVSTPTRGSIQVLGRVSALLALGIGLHRDLTGWENINLIASLMGMSETEVRNNLESIAEFADLADFINEPVRTYSSGMTARLGFSVAIHANPDILILDEVLSVGDEAFRAKCKAKIAEFTNSEKTLLFVSHGLQTAVSLCTRGLWLNGGVVAAEGPVPEVVQTYREFTKSGQLSTHTGPSDSLSARAEELASL